MRTTKIKKMFRTAALLLIMLMLVPQAFAQDENSKEFTYRTWLNGENYRVPITGNTMIGESPISALNLYFKTPYRGEYTIIVTAYNTYIPALSNTKQYFSVSPSFDLTGNSSIEINSPVDIAIYQLYDGGEWRRLLTKKIAEGVYLAPISALGIFAIREERLQVPVQQVQKKPGQQGQIQSLLSIIKSGKLPDVNEWKIFLNSMSLYVQAADWQTYNALHRHIDPILEDITREIRGLLK